MADSSPTILREIEPRLNRKSDRHSIDRADHSRSINFVLLVAWRQFLRFQAKLDDQEPWKARLADAGIVVLPGMAQTRRLHFRLDAREAEQHRALPKALFAAGDQQQQQQGD